METEAHLHGGPERNTGTLGFDLQKAVVVLGA